MQYLWTLYLWLPRYSSHFRRAGCSRSVFEFAAPWVFTFATWCCTLWTTRLVLGTPRNLCTPECCNAYFEGQSACFLPMRLLSAWKISCVGFLFEAVSQPNIWSFHLLLDYIGTVLWCLSSWASICMLSSLWWLVTAGCLLHQAGSY